MSDQKFNKGKKAGKQSKSEAPSSSSKKPQNPSSSKKPQNQPKPETELPSTSASAARKRQGETLKLTQPENAFQDMYLYTLPTVSSAPYSCPPADGVQKEPKPLEVIHELTNRWTFWYFEHEPHKYVEEMIHPAATFQYAEEFWLFYYRIKQPMDLKHGSNYSIFKEGIRPLARDPANLRGGRWLLKLNNARAVELQAKWLDVMLCLIGGQMDEGNQLCGAQVNVGHSRTKIGIWTASASDKTVVLAIGRKLQDVLKLPKWSMSYVPNSNLLKKGGTNFAPIYNL